MNFDEYTGQVQNRHALPSTDESLGALRATLTSLGERLQAGEAPDLAASLPMEIDRYLTEAEYGRRFDWDEFADRVWERGDMTDEGDRADAAYHAQVVVDVTTEAVPPGEMRQVRDGLPADEGWGTLFELVDRDGGEE